MQDEEDEIELAPKINTYKEVTMNIQRYSTFLKAEGMQWKLLKWDESHPDHQSEEYHSCFVVWRSSSGGSRK